MDQVLLCREELIALVAFLVAVLVKGFLVVLSELRIYIRSLSFSSFPGEWVLVGERPGTLLPHEDSFSQHWLDELVDICYPHARMEHSELLLAVLLDRSNAGGSLHTQPARV